MNKRTIIVTAHGVEPTEVELLREELGKVGDNPDSVLVRPYEVSIQEVDLSINAIITAVGAEAKDVRLLKKELEEAKKDTSKRIRFIVTNFEVNVQELGYPKDGADEGTERSPEESP